MVCSTDLRLVALPSRYINDQQYTSHAPVKRSDLRQTDLSEETIKRDFPVLGYRVSCIYLWRFFTSL